MAPKRKTNDSEEDWVVEDSASTSSDEAPAFCVKKKKPSASSVKPTDGNSNANVKRVKKESSDNKGKKVGMEATVALRGIDNNRILETSMEEEVLFHALDNAGEAERAAFRERWEMVNLAEMKAFALRARLIADQANLLYNHYKSKPNPKPKPTPAKD